MDEDKQGDNVNVLESSSAPMDQTLVHLHEIMAEIIVDCTAGASIKLCNHATSFFQGVT
jgi:uncharacterized protein YejL (UPF0352 family)